MEALLVIGGIALGYVIASIEPRAKQVELRDEDTNEKIDLEVDMTKKKKTSRLKKISKAVSKGNIGDAIKEVTDAVGIEQCDDCAKRQVALNFGDKKQAKDIELLEGDYKELNAFFSVPPNDSDSNSYRFASTNQYRNLIAIHNKYFKDKTEKPNNCQSCRIKMIQRLKLIYNGKT